MLILKTSARFAKVMVSTFLSIIYITEEEISGEALLAIEKDDIKDIGVQPMGRRIELMAKIKEITSIQTKEHPGEVESKLENSSVFKEQEEEKKHKYQQWVLDVEMGLFMPLVLGTNGRMGNECQ